MNALEMRTVPGIWRFVDNSVRNRSAADVGDRRRHTSQRQRGVDSINSKGTLLVSKKRCHLLERLSPNKYFCMAGGVA
jgi:hypothetical protein